MWWLNLFFGLSHSQVRTDTNTNTGRQHGVAFYMASLLAPHLKIALIRNYDIVVRDPYVFPSFNLERVRRRIDSRLAKGERSFLLPCNMTSIDLSIVLWMSPTEKSFNFFL